jgi:hypothetical protein
VASPASPGAVAVGHVSFQHAKPRESRPSVRCRRGLWWYALFKPLEASVNPKAARRRYPQSANCCLSRRRVGCQQWQRKRPVSSGQVRSARATRIGCRSAVVRVRRQSTQWSRWHSSGRVTGVFLLPPLAELLVRDRDFSDISGGCQRLQLRRQVCLERRWRMRYSARWRRSCR